jgi:hypothetical protein
MANEQNLIPFTERSESEVRKLNSKGGVNSGEARRRKRDIRLALEALLEKDISDKHGNTMSTAEAIALKQIEKALKGDTRAFEVVRDSAGQKPNDRIDITVNDDSAKEMDEYFARHSKGTDKE